MSPIVRGQVLVHDSECKGCGLCVESCPVHALALSHTRLNRIGYFPVEYLDSQGCTGCAVCFYACPEPGALHVLRYKAGLPAASKPEEAAK